MRTTEQIKDFIDAFTNWALAQPDIEAAALVGSYARGAATDTSDIDLVLLVGDPHRYIENTGWSTQFGTVARQQIEDYGLLTSLRVWYAGGHEVEYGLTTPAWIQAPLDDGTRRVIQDGMKVLFERGALLSRAV